MPIYTFKCSNCNHTADHLMKYSQSIDTDNISCPICKSKNYHKLLSTPSIINNKSNGYKPCGLENDNPAVSNCQASCSCSKH